jgi:hypothetical protein
MSAAKSGWLISASLKYSRVAVAKLSHRDEYAKASRSAKMGVNAHEGRLNAFRLPRPSAPTLRLLATDRGRLRWTTTATPSDQRLISRGCKRD